MSDSASVTSKVSTSLRKRVLKRTATSATVTPPPSTSEKQPDPNNITETAVVHVDTISEPQTSDLEDIETSSLSSAASTSSRRVSLLYMSPSRGTGVHMDLVTGVANDLLQKGKEALEMADVTIETKQYRESLYCRRATVPKNEITLGTQGTYDEQARLPKCIRGELIDDFSVLRSYSRDVGLWTMYSLHGRLLD
ncbi:unnamed protein product [Euphydryas editha]|uniref:Uncharacterized protein n=1 Tax=Euphydryas editha TaxID=104508 RepID=A0AAU9UEM3_EUPED|nr:unnamed protein product [Euphydryas editha]